MTKEENHTPGHVAIHTSGFVGIPQEEGLMAGETGLMLTVRALMATVFPTIKRRVANGTLGVHSYRVSLA